MTYSIVIYATDDHYTAELLPSTITSTGKTPRKAVEHLISCARIKLNRLNNSNPDNLGPKDKELLEEFYDIHN